MSTLLVGSIVGPLGTDDAEAAAALADAGKGYDFALGGLGFRVRPTDQTPYERSTAQFRKDQYDSGDQVGDQSLVGWWTRGQFSFHKGAGIRYYDVSPTVTDRYLSGEGANPFTPGKVTCSPGWDAEATALASMTWAGATRTQCVAVTGTTLRYGADANLASSYAPASSVNHATCGPATIYMAVGSTIEKNPSAPTQLYTHWASVSRLWYAKDRLWAMDSTNTLYQLSPSPATPPVAIAVGDKVWQARDVWDTNWVLADTPGPVLLANGNRIFAITVSGDGTVPNTQAPTQVAELPGGETIRGLHFSLGFVVIATSEGLWVAVLSDTGQVTYGPLLVEWTTAPERTTLAAKGSSALVTADAKVYEVNLAHQVGDGLEFAWSVRSTPFTSVTNSGVFSFGGNIVAWSDTSTWVKKLTALSTGTLTTGYHRFGTMEPKKFHTVRVRVGGTAGTVAVARVDRNGSVFPLYTIDVSRSAGEDITMKMDLPDEMVALKFTLTPSGSTSPELLGYQLRALPAPKRQRLIRVPLMLQDVERRGTTRATGRPGDAYRRLIELENMEQSGGTFIFQDFRTGESGQCFIEQIEHRGTTPPSRQDAGFGGLVYVTLRVL